MNVFTNRPALNSTITLNRAFTETTQLLTTIIELNDPDISTEPLEKLLRKLSNKLTQAHLQLRAESLSTPIAGAEVN